MKMRAKFLIVMLVATVVGFMLGGQAPVGSMIYPPDTTGPTPTAGQLPFFMILAVLEALAFGLGVAFLVFGLGWFKNALPGRGNLAIAAYLSSAWWLVNWVPHTGVHMNAGMDLQKLLYIEYGFHVTLMIAGAVLLWYIAAIAMARAPMSMPTPATKPTAKAKSA